MFIDTHLHLVNEDYDIDSVITRAKESDVNYLIVSGSDLFDNRLNKIDNSFFIVLSSLKKCICQCQKNSSKPKQTNISLGVGMCGWFSDKRGR